MAAGQGSPALQLHVSPPLRPMNISPRFRQQFYRLNLSSSLLIVLLQRVPVVRALALAEDMVISSPLGAVLKAAFVGAATLGAIDTMAGATQLATSSSSPLTVAAGSSLPGGGVAFEIVGTPGEGATSYTIGGSMPPGLSFSGTTSGDVTGETIFLSGTPTTPGNYTLSITGNNLSFGSVGPYSYTIIVTGGGGGNTAPAITLNPASQTVNAGTNVSFTAAASGTPAPSVQWQKNSVDVPGATSTTLTLFNVQPGDNGTYTMTATNVVSSATSTGAVLTVNPGNTAPVITLNPVSQNADVGATVVFTSGASGTPAPTYQWQKNSANIPGATSTTLTLNNVQAGDGASYTMVATNSVSSATSAPGVLTINVPTAPAITLQPVGQTVLAGATVTLTAAANGYPAPTYQWQKNSTNIPGATSTTFTLASAQTGDSGSYRMLATNSVSSATTNAVTVTVNPPTPPAITLQPASQTGFLAGSVTFTAAASGNPAPTYQWQKDTVDLPGATSATLTLNNLQPGDAGSYRMIATNTASSATTNPAVLTVTLPPGFIKLSAGRYHSFRISDTAQLYATGANAYGQLGNGNTSPANSPQAITLSGKTLVAMAAGGQHSLLLTSTNELWMAGINDNGQLNDGTVTTRTIPFQAATNVAGVAASVFHSAFLKTDGTLWTVGGNDEGQLGNGNATDQHTAVQIATNVVDLATGNRQTLFVKSDGTLWGAGDLYNNGTLTSTPIQLATGVRTVAAGAYHSLFIKTDGTLWALGFNGSGQLGNGDTTTQAAPVQIATGVKAVSCGYFFSVFLKTDNTLWSTGANGSGQLGDGSVNARSTPYQLATNVAAVSASENYTVYLKNDGTLWGTGYNALGQFGNGATTSSSTPVQISVGTVTTSAAPANVAAAPNAAADRVNVTWQASATAASYEVWRSTTNSFGTATRIAQNVRWGFYQDLTASANITYYYWVTAVNPAGTSVASAPAAGGYGTPVAPGFTMQP